MTEVETEAVADEAQRMEDIKALATESRDDLRQAAFSVGNLKTRCDDEANRTFLAVANDCIEQAARFLRLVDLGKEPRE